MDAYQIPESIQWHEGLLLTPQHFQQLALRQEMLLQYVSAAAAPFLYGVRHLKLDTGALAAGRFSVLALEAVMPDCLVVSYDARRGDDGRQGDGNGGQRVGPLEAKLGAYDKELGEGTMTVYLVVPSRGDQSRYGSVPGDLVNDETTGEGQLRIPRLRPRLSLLVEKAPPPPRYVSLPLARVTRKGDSYSLDPEFEPPTTAVGRKTPLGMMCSDLAARMRKQAVYLADRLRGPAEGARAYDISMLRSLVTPLPLLEAVLATDATHPYYVYLTLCTAAGNVALMGSGGVVPDPFPAYDHDDPRTSFAHVIKYIDDKINEGVTPAYAGHRFRYEDGFYNLMFEGEWERRRLVLGLRPQPGTTEQELVRWGRECLIGSEPYMELMRAHRIPGAGRDLAEPDEELVPPRGVVLFSLEYDSKIIEPNETLQIFNPTERGQRARPAEITLYVRKATSEGPRPRESR